MRNHDRGFTLIETMVVVAIVAILAAVAIPSMKSVIESTAVAGHVNGLVGSINFARAEAIKRSVAVVICRSTDAETAATPSCATGPDSVIGWGSGWLVFADRNGNRSFDNNTDTVLRVQGAMTNSGGITNSGDSTMSFRLTGITSSDLASFKFKSKSLAAVQERILCVSRQGRTRVIKDSSQACET